MFDHNRVVFSLSCDVLASHWGTIKNSTQYVLRSASHGDLSIVDNIYQSTANIKRGNKSLTGWTYSTPTSGYYVVGIINKDPSAVGCVSYYVFTASQFAALKNKLMASYDYMNISSTELSDELQRAIIDPFKYIVSCKWFPEKPPTNGTATPITISGWELTGVSAYYLAPSAVTVKSYNAISLEQHPQINVGTWLRLSPYTNYYLLFPPFGVISLNPSKIIDNRITIDVRIDYITGIGTISITSPKANETSLVYMADTNVGVDIQLTQQSFAESMISDVSNTINAITTTTVGMATGNILAAISGVSSGANSLINNKTLQGAFTGAVTDFSTGNYFSSIGSSALAANGQLEVIGSNGSFASYQLTPYIFWQFVYIVDQDNEDLGTPCCKKLVLANLSGFTAVSKPDISIVATTDEISMLITWLSNGFFIE